MLTERQRQILDFLTKYADAHGYPPTVREIGEAVGLASPSTVHAHLANLERAGLLKRDPTKPRAIELRREPKAPVVAESDVHKLPLVGEVAAGGPLLAEDNIEEYLAVPEPLSRGGEEFLLRVKGDSMINAGILDGDIAVVERAQDARNGDIVVALAGDDESADEATLKRFFKEDGRVRLQPENDALEPIYAAARPDPRQGDRSLPAAMSVEALNRTLEQELFALLRGASLECLVCGEFVLHRAGSVSCPECQAEFRRSRTDAATIDACRPGDREPFAARGKSGHRRAGRWGNPRRRKPTESGTERRPPAATNSPETLTVRVKRWGKSPPALW